MIGNHRLPSDGGDSPGELFNSFLSVTITDINSSKR
jgi:hypothetical protein